MCNFFDKHKVLALQVCVLCNLDIELVVETMFAAVENGADVGVGKKLDEDGFSLLFEVLLRQELCW